MTEGIITIRKGREKPIINQHPWIFSGAIAKAENANDGDIVTVVDYKGDFLARGYWNHKSAIQVRILTWHDEPIDEAWWRKMLKRAIARRTYRYGLQTCRLVNAENDFLPGLIIDCYTDNYTDEIWLVIQALTLHIDKQKQEIVQLIVQLLGEGQPPFAYKVMGVYERSDVEVRGKEGLAQKTGVLWGENPPELIRIVDSVGVYIGVDVRHGHKTGHYLDQAHNHLLLFSLIEDMGNEPSILNLFSYTGAFGLAGLRANAQHVVNVDASKEALAIAKLNVELSKLSAQKAEFIQADVFDYLRECVEKGEQYDIVVLDPPKFANNKQQVDKAARGYKDINLNAFKIIKSGGYLMTFSCSGAISRDLFQKIVFGALADSGRQAQIIKHLSAADDHPVALTFPEGEYLKGLLLRVY